MKNNNPSDIDSIYDNTYIDWNKTIESYNKYHSTNNSIIESDIDNEEPYIISGNGRGLYDLIMERYKEYIVYKND